MYSLHSGKPDIPVAGDDIESKIARAKAILKSVLLDGHPLCVSFSAGKDSSATLNLALTAATELQRAGCNIPPIVIAHANTGVENPELVAYAKTEMIAVRNFAQKNNIDLRIETSHPLLRNTWAVNVISGRSLPPFPGSSRQCTLEWKINPMDRLRRRVMKELGYGAKDGRPEPVTLLGTRFSESAERAKKMAERRDHDQNMRRGKDSSGRPQYLYLSPIAFWETDTVYEYLALAMAGAIESYSNFEETFRIYADAGGSSCVIVAEDIANSLKSSKGGCGARHGCSLCTAVGRDRSMENMLAKEERYRYMRDLNKLQRFILATRWDLARRNWLGRTVNEGWVKIAPDTYSPAMMEELLRISLSIDARERQSAGTLGIEPRFQLVSVEQLFSIDALWSLQGHHKPFHAIHIYRDVVVYGNLVEVPELDEIKKISVPKPRYLWVGDDWNSRDLNPYDGMRDVWTDTFPESHCQRIRKLPSGLEISDIETSESMEINAEAADFTIKDDIDRLLTQYHDHSVDPFAGGHAAAWSYYKRLGLLSLKAGSEQKYDEIMRRTAFKNRNGITSEANVETLLANSISETDLKRIREGNLLKLPVEFGDTLQIAEEPDFATAGEELLVESRQSSLSF